MSELERTYAVVPAEIMDPTTGELVSTSDIDGIGQTISNLRQAENQLRDFRRNVEQIVVAEAERQGTKTLHVQGRDLELRGGRTLEWDIEILQELQALGLPEDRYGELVQTRVEYKVNASVAKQIEAANDEYAEVIRRARSYVEKPVYVTVKEK